MDFDTLKLIELEKVFGNELKDYYEDALREEAKEPLGYALDYLEALKEAQMLSSSCEGIGIFNLEYKTLEWSNGHFEREPSAGFRYSEAFLERKRELLDGLLKNEVLTREFHDSQMEKYGIPTEEKPEIEFTKEDFALAKKFIPTLQYQVIMSCIAAGRKRTISRKSCAA